MIRLKSVHFHPPRAADCYTIHSSRCLKTRRHSWGPGGLRGAMTAVNLGDKQAGNWRDACWDCQENPDMTWWTETRDPPVRYVIHSERGHQYITPARDLLCADAAVCCIFNTFQNGYKNESESWLVQTLQISNPVSKINIVLPAWICESP